MTRTAREIAREVLEIEAATLQALIPQLDESFDRAVEAIRESAGRVVCTGMGKSGLIMKKIAATLASTGTPAFFLHPAEAIHGDLGMIVAGDVVLAASYSGKTEELLRLAEILARLGDVTMIIVTGNAESPLAQTADIHLPVEIDKEACPLNLAPTASTTATLALGDALAMALHETQGFTPEDFARFHPGGNLGKRLLRVEELMHTGEDLPSVRLETPLRETIYEMSRGKLGITAVVDEAGRLLGCISDGDLRRFLEQGEGAELLARRSEDLMHESPRTISRDALASAALHELEEHRITSIFVCDEDRSLEGIVHLHDLWRLELF